MVLEAVAGKIPMTHVGKIYNVIARKIAETLVQKEIDIIAAQCFMATQIGTPIKEPALLHITLATRDDMPVAQFKSCAEEVARECLARTPELVDGFIAGTIDLF